MESFSVGESKYLLFQVESLKNTQFTLVDAWYKITCDGTVVVERGQANYTSDGQIRFLFSPQNIGHYVVDVWYEVSLAVGNIGVEPVKEVRTSRNLFQVVR